MITYLVISWFAAGFISALVALRQHLKNTGVILLRNLFGFAGLIFLGWVALAFCVGFAYNKYKNVEIFRRKS